MPLCNVLPNEITQTFSINFNHKQNEIERLFTLKRKNDETLNSLAKRMKINLKKVFNKKQSKQNSSKENGHNEITDDSNEEFVINFVYQNNNVDLNTKICDFFKNGIYFKYFKMKILIDIIISESELHINGQIYSIVLNYPDIVQLKLPKIILSGYYIYPHLDLSNGNIIDSEFIWYKNTSPLLGDEWIKIHEGFLYYVKEDDLNCRLKVICIPKEGEKIGIPKEIISQALIIQGPSDCPFEKRFSFTESITEMDEFRIVSYNILADLYVNSDQSRDVLYEYCKNEYLDFDYRKCLLTKELLGYHSDIYFLQEVDFLYYNTGLKPIFQLHGMDSYFASKENKSEGLGIFYNLTKFKCLRKESHSYAELLSSLELFEWLKIKINDNPNLSKRFTKLKNIFQIILLQSNHYHNRLLLLCNLHLYSKDGADHIRLLQTFMTLKYLEQIITETKSNVNILLANKIVIKIFSLGKL